MRAAVLAVLIVGACVPARGRGVADPDASLELASPTRERAAPWCVPPGEPIPMPESGITSLPNACVDSNVIRVRPSPTPPNPATVPTP